MMPQVIMVLLGKGDRATGIRRCSDAASLAVSLVGMRRHRFMRITPPERITPDVSPGISPGRNGAVGCERKGPGVRRRRHGRSGCAQGNRSGRRTVNR